MHLKRIQLVGFKSFVDPTTIPVLSHMNAIVGPNGCGKSNIVDAIRWVIGEISAKQLRGQSMSDVIFNGSSGRKSVGKAAVELTFDNSDSRIAGEYGKFSEISVRREVVRDGQSAYFINGVQARRRDLLDLFLGTGLGPRSYSIIEQGMIAQLIETKPEELRSHFEEVAGISKYRERRRETETRIRHTQENLDRLNDLREELEKQLRHLKRQSAAAERYKALKQEARLVQAQIKTLQWKALELRLDEKNLGLQQQVLQYEAQVSKLRALETEIEKLRDLSLEWNDKKEAVQKAYYQLGSEITRYEQQIQHKQEQIAQWELEFKNSQNLWEELSAQSTSQTNHIHALKQELSTLTPQKATALQASEEAKHYLQAAEKSMLQTQTEWEAFQAQAAQINQSHIVAKTNQSHYETQVKQLHDRQSQLQSQLAALPIGALSTEIQPLNEKGAQLKTAVSNDHERLNQLSQAIIAQRALYQETQVNTNKARGELQKYEAQYASLAAMQEATLQDQQAAIKPWLSEQGLVNKPRFGKSMTVAPGWELAVETLLAHYFDAICVDQLDHLTPQLDSLSKGQFSAFERHTLSKPRLPHKTVTEVITHCLHLPNWLSSVYITEDLTTALSLKSSLQPHESIITKTGIWMGSNWVRMNKAAQPEESFLIKEKRLKDLDAEITEKRAALTALESTLSAAKEKLESKEKEREVVQQSYQQNLALLTDAQSRLSATQSKLDNLTQQKRQIEETLASIAVQNTQSQTALQNALEAIAQCAQKQTELALEKESISTKREQSQKHLQTARETAQQKRQYADEMGLRLSSTENQLAVLTQSVTSNQKQLLQLTERRETLQAQLLTAKGPLVAWRQSLQNTLDQQLSIEQELKAVVSQWESYQEQLRGHSTERDVVNKNCLQLQEEQQQLKMAQQEILVRQSSLKEQIIEAQFDLTELIQQMPQGATLTAWEETAAQLHTKIERLGPINLAAIDEYKTTEERKVYLDQQYTDLQEALTVLQNAIRKIDRETRHLFRDTYDKVNERFQAIFPKIFGGGQAMLELTDDDLLTTGIIVKAQPPGKRNATIHMLSGGEKTLTAIALMFAMFQLNPAPFCVLDEVDAPLDDLNVGRFCQLVKEMSKDTQFLIISHNKVTIEAADHLMGVTMQEAGVSRIVSVDIAAAVEMVSN